MSRRGGRKSIARMLATGASLLAACVCFGACAHQAEPAIARPAETPLPAVSNAGTPLDRLCACEWVDAYDKNFILAFDKLGGQMTERNDAAGIKRVSRVAVEEEALLVYDELGILAARLPYTLEEDLLRIDYGEPLGVLEYKAVR